MDEKKKKLKSMATYTATVFAAIFAIVFAVLWLPLYPTSTSSFDAIGKVFAAGWLLLLADLVLCVGVYLGYYLYVHRIR